MKNQFSKITSLIVLAEIVTVIVPVMVLGTIFEFPAILRQPAQQTFTLFNQNQFLIIAAYYLFLLSALLYIPLSYLLADLLDTNNGLKSKLLIGTGLVTALFQAIGFCRWIFVMPYLTRSYYQDPANRSITIQLYEVLNRYAGMTIGEHLGFMAMGCWTILLGAILLQHPGAKKRIGFIGIGIGFLLMLSAGEQFGGEGAYLFSMINFVANTLWTFFLLLLGILLQVKPKKILLSV